MSPDTVLRALAAMDPRHHYARGLIERAREALGPGRVEYCRKVGRNLWVSLKVERESDEK